MNNYLKEALGELSSKSYPSWENDNVPYGVIKTADVKSMLEVFDAKWKGFFEVEIDRRVNNKLLEEMETRKKAG